MLKTTHVLKYILSFLLISGIVYGAANKLPDFGIIPKATGSRPTGVEGDLFADSTTHRLQYKDNSAWYNLIGPATPDTLTNKTLTSPVINTPTGIVKGDVGLGNVDNTSDATKNSASATLTNKTISGASNTLTVRAANDITGQLPIANGGTGQATATAALNALLPSQGSAAGKVFTSDGTNADWQTPATAPDQSYEISNCTLTASVGSNALTIALKDKAGNDPSVGSPCKVGFRNVTSATGDYAQRTVTSALSLTISSGSTLGHASGVFEYLYVYLLDNSGTLVLAVSSNIYADNTRQSTVTEGGAGAADAFADIYSASAHTSKVVRLIGRMASVQATAGTWATAISEISLMPFNRATMSRSTSGQEFIERAFITNDGSNCAASRTSSNWVTSLSRSGTGRCDLTIRTGIWSSAPVCVVAEYKASNAPNCYFSSNVTQTSIIVQCYNTSSSSNQDADFHLICMGI